MVKQRGLSLIGLLITSAVVVFFCSRGVQAPAFLHRVLDHPAHRQRPRPFARAEGNLDNQRAKRVRPPCHHRQREFGQGQGLGSQQGRRGFRDRHQLVYARAVVRQHQRLPRLRGEELGKLRITCTCATARSLEGDENVSGCVRCGACCVALLAKVPTLAAERRLAVIRT